MNASRSSDQVHSSIFAAIKAVSNGATGGDYGSPQRMRAFSNWSRVWTKRHWLGLVSSLVALIPVIALPLELQREIGRHASGALFLGGLAIWFGAVILACRKDQANATWEEIEALRPILALSENQQIYLDCVKAVLETRLLDEKQKESWLLSLKSSLDQAIELEAIYADLKDAVGGSTLQQLVEDRQRIADRMKGANDPTSREIFRQSLALADDRLQSSGVLAAQVERAEAHLELTRLTLIRTKESLRGLEIGAKQSAEIDLEPLRANLAKVREDAQAVRSAIDELSQFRSAPSQRLAA